MHRSFLGALIGAALLLAACAVAPSQTELSLVATVGLDPDVCATDALLELATTQPQTVYTCYTITNDGGSGVTVHDLSDDLHGEVLFGFEYLLAPGASVSTVEAGVVLESVVAADTVNEARWDAFANGRRSASASASSEVRLVPPLQYGAAVGTFVGDGNLDGVGAFAGNVVVLGILDLAGEPIAETVDVVITPAGGTPFTYTFDPAAAADGEVVLWVDDFAAPAALPSTLAGRPLAFVQVAPSQGIAPSAIVAGDWTFAFPGRTITRTVDATQALAVPAVAEVVVDGTGTELTVTFATTDGASYDVAAYGTGDTGVYGETLDAANPATVVLDAALDPGQGFVVDLYAFRGGEDDLYADPAQIDAAAYLHQAAWEVE
jgi:hypothetical protein